jgi:hypothetical protein
MSRVAAHAGDNAPMEMLLSVSSGCGSHLEELKAMPGVVAREASHGFGLILPSLVRQTTEVFMAG